MSALKPRHSHGKIGRTKKRCTFPKCKKLAKDFDPPLCRIHSPKRRGYYLNKKK